MSKLDLEELENLKSSAMAHIQLRGEMTYDSLCVALGKTAWTKTGTGRKQKRSSNKTVLRLIDQLKSEGLIRTRMSNLDEQLKIYPIDHREKTLFQKSSRPLQVSVSVDPNIAGTWQPPIKPAKRVPTNSALEDVEREARKLSIKTEKEEEMSDALTKHLGIHSQGKKDQRSPEEVRKAIEDSLNQLIESGKPFTQQDLTRLAKIGNSTLYKHRDLQQKVSEASKNSRKDPVSPTTSLAVNPFQEHSELELLRSQIAQLQQQNRELQQQSNSQDDLVALLRQEEAHWLATIKRIEQERKQLDEDERSAIANLYSCQRLLACKTGNSETPAMELVYVAPTNGNHAIAVAS